MKRGVLILVFLVAVLLMMFILNGNIGSKLFDKNKAPEVGLEVGNIAPDFEIETLSHGKIKLSDFKGKKVFMNFWTTWCLPCQSEILDIQKLNDSHEDIVVLAVNMSSKENYYGAVDVFVEELNLDLIIPMDKESELKSLYEIKPIPIAYMIDTNGIIRDVVVAKKDYDSIMKSMNKLD